MIQEILLILLAVSHSQRNFEVAAKSTGREVYVTPDRIRLESGSNIKFECRHRGYPSNIIVVWSKHGKNLPSNANSLDNILIINGVNKENLGEYWCSIVQDTVEIARGRTILLGKGSPLQYSFAVLVISLFLKLMLNLYFS